MEVCLDRLPGDHKSATVLLWHVEEGDPIEEGSHLVKLSVEGKSFNFSSPVTGIINDIYYEEGEEITLGELIATIEEENNKEEEAEDTF